ncbi:MAG: hypothetical protein HY536_01560, partial [Candidatus Colwellbacteria bacterium]|nr:hypothetical protein [Candidatus Colwellbacteria bacterium]
MFSFFLRFSTTVFAQLAGLVVLLLVVRLCVVFFHSRRRYWRSAGVAPRRGAVEARARLLSVPLPFMTILIPAREEALVIRNTILSMARLDYPRDRYAVVVVTDEKERRNGSRCATTQSVVEETKRELSMTFPDMTLVHEEVPHDFDGRIGGACVGTPVPSTKGRALNWALSRISEKTDFCVFVDAEGHLLPH